MQTGSPVFGDGVPAVIYCDLGGGAYGFSDAARLGVVDEVHGGSAGDLGLDEAVFSVPDKRGVGIDVGREWACSHVSVVIVDGVERINRGVLVEEIWCVVVRYREGEAVGGFQAVADEVELVGAVEAGDGAVGAGDLPEGIVAPGDVAGAGEGGAGLGDVAALADGIHEVIILRYNCGASFVFLGVEDVAVCFPCVGDGVGGAGDSIYQ